MIEFLKRLFGQDKKSWEALIPILEKGEEPELNKLLWRRNNKPEVFLPVTFLMLKRLSKPDSIAAGLRVHEVWRNGKFILVIFEVPWSEEDLKYSPLIIDTKNNKVAGIMLPFNELHGVLTPAESDQIGDLGIKWTSWIIRKRFGS
jgi:hypothetical protein